MALVMTSGPALEPVTVDEAKSHLRIDGTNEDVLLSSLIMTSRLHVETALNLALITQGWTLLLDEWPKLASVELPLRPLQQVAEVRVKDGEGSAITVDASDYVVDTASSHPRLVRKGGTWPLPGQLVNGIEVDLIVGYGNAATDVPASIRQALLLLIAHWYEHRDSVEIGSAEVAIPQSVSRLLHPYVPVRL